MKRTLSLILALTVIFTFTAVGAKKELSHNSSDYAVFLSGNFYGHNSMTVDGSVYTSNGDVTFDSSSGNVVKGDIVLNSLKQYSYATENSKPDIRGKVIKDDKTKFTEAAPAINYFPNIVNRIDTFTAGWYPTPEPITQNTHYNKLTVNGHLKVDVSKGDIIIVAEKLEILGGSLELIGKGKLYIVTYNDLIISAPVNVSGDKNQVKLFVYGKLDIGSVTMKANVYVDTENMVLSGSPLFTGNIITTAKTVDITGNATLNGVVYAPNADFKLGNGRIDGRLVAKSLEIFGNTTIKYIATNIDLAPPFEAPKAVLTVKVEPEQAGIVTPAQGTYNVGTETTISVTANTGYKFKEFVSENGTAIPDANGKIIINGDTNLKAIFEVDTPPVSDDIPIGPEVSIDFPYGYLYGYGDDSGNVGVNDTIKREEATSLIYRLLKNNNKLGGFVKPDTSTYLDISSNRWSYAALEYMTSIGIYKNFGDNIFPLRPITRGEAAKIICYSLRIRPDSSKPGSVAGFSDLPTSNIYYTYVKALVDKGVMNGNGNGTITPDAFVTRAEFIKMINMIIGRDSRYDISSLECPYVDLVGYNKTSWQYENLMRASFGFSYDNEKGIYIMDSDMKPTREQIDLS